MSVVLRIGSAEAYKEMDCWASWGEKEQGWECGQVQFECAGDSTRRKCQGTRSIEQASRATQPVSPEMGCRGGQSRASRATGQPCSLGLAEVGGQHCEGGSCGQQGQAEQNQTLLSEKGISHQGHVRLLGCPLSTHRFMRTKPFTAYKNKVPKLNIFLCVKKKEELSLHESDKFHTWNTDQIRGNIDQKPAFP